MTPRPWDVTMPAIDQDWRAPTTRNATLLFTTRPAA
jgi:hypothetical protein